MHQYSHFIAEKKKDGKNSLPGHVAQVSSRTENFYPGTISRTHTLTDLTYSNILIFQESGTGGSE